jgi:hypothetical protein
MPRRDLPVGPVRSVWTGAGRGRDEEPTEHRCARCYGPYGKSNIRCVNEPPVRTSAEQLLHDIFENTEES